ncbi:Protein pigeon, partial [Orchesella cincta]
QSTFDEEEASKVIVKPMLSVLQFHNDFPRESVLNMPLDVDTGDVATSFGVLVPDPSIISSKSVNLKVCAHSSGAVYIFYVHHPSNDTKEVTAGNSSPETSHMKLKYSVNLLHHNKTLVVQYDLESSVAACLPLKMDVSTFAYDQYLAVIGWPAFIHILDVGVTHEPSHHITLTFSSFISLSQTVLPSFPSQPFLMIVKSDITSNCDDKLSAFTLNFAKEDLTLHQVQLSPAKLHQFLEKNVLSTKVKLAVIHYILVHAGDINVCKRIIYDEGKRIGNLNLTRIYQEFLVGAAYAQTKKQLLPNMEQFLSLIPYAPHYPSEGIGHHENLSFELNTNWTEVCTMLLSPSQRVFPHNVTD